MYFYGIGTNEFRIFFISEIRKIKRSEQRSQCMMLQSKIPKCFCKLNKDSRNDEPAYHRNGLPEYPMHGAFGRFLHFPGIIKRNISFPGGYACFGKKLRKTK